MTASRNLTRGFWPCADLVVDRLSVYRQLLPPTAGEAGPRQQEQQQQHDSLLQQHHSPLQQHHSLLQPPAMSLSTLRKLSPRCPLPPTTAVGAAPGRGRHRGEWPTGRRCVGPRWPVVAHVPSRPTDHRQPTTPYMASLPRDCLSAAGTVTADGRDGRQRAAVISSGPIGGVERSKNTGRTS